MDKGFDEKLDLEIPNQNTNNPNAQENSSLKKKKPNTSILQISFL